MFIYYNIEMVRKGEKLSPEHAEKLAAAREKALAIRRQKADEKKDIKLAKTLKHEELKTEARDIIEKATKKVTTEQSVKHDKEDEQNDNDDDVEIEPEIIVKKKKKSSKPVKKPKQVIVYQSDTSSDSEAEQEIIIKKKKSKKIKTVKEQETLEPKPLTAIEKEEIMKQTQAVSQLNTVRSHLFDNLRL